MNDTASDLGSKLNELAEDILDEMLTPGNEVNLEQRIDALKAIGTLHLGLLRISGKLKPPPDEPGEPIPSMDEMRAKIKAVS